MNEPHTDRRDDPGNPDVAPPDTGAGAGEPAGPEHGPGVVEERSLGQCYRDLKAILDGPLPDLKGTLELLRDISKSAKEN